MQLLPIVPRNLNGKDVRFKIHELLRYHFHCHGNLFTIATRYVANAYYPKEALRDNKSQVLAQFTTFTTTFVVRQCRRCKLAISLFYSLTNDFVTFSLYNLAFIKDPLCENSRPYGYFYNLYNLLYNLHDLLYNFSPPIIRYPKVPCHKILPSSMESIVEL